MTLQDARDSVLKAETELRTAREALDKELTYDPTSEAIKNMFCWTDEVRVIVENDKYNVEIELNHETTSFNSHDLVKIQQQEGLYITNFHDNVQGRNGSLVRFVLLKV